MRLGEGVLDRLNDVFFAKPNLENGLTGLFPAIVGTFSLVMVMTLFVAPLGVATAIYLTEYARDTGTPNLFVSVSPILQASPPLSMASSDLDFLSTDLADRLMRFFMRKDCLARHSGRRVYFGPPSHPL